LKKLTAAVNPFVLPENLGKKKLSEVFKENSDWSTKKTIITAEGCFNTLIPTVFLIYSESVRKSLEQTAGLHLHTSFYSKSLFEII
jgi:hypothetical protein